MRLGDRGAYRGELVICDKALGRERPCSILRAVFDCVGDGRQRKQRELLYGA